MQQPLLLSGKKILIISPNNWGKIHVSKHHYSIELAKRGNEIYFLEPAISKNKKGFHTRVEEHKINIVTQHIPMFAELLRFKVRWLYNFYAFFFVKKLLSRINQKFDIVWCFETNLYSNLKWFNGKYTIYHPVDVLAYDFQIRIAKTANIAFSISETITAKVKSCNENIFFVNHGLSNHFKAIAEKKLEEIKTEQSIIENSISVGFVGNLLRPEINRLQVIQLIKRYSQTLFNFWGPTNYYESNVDGDRNEEVFLFIQELKNAPNIMLHGVLSGVELAKLLAKNDIMLLPLKNNKNYDGSNSHKIIEYLSTGKVIVSHYVSTYSSLNLLEMATSDKLVDIETVFDKVHSNISFYNSSEKMKSRIEYALENTYKKQIDRIEKLINNTINF